MKVFVTGGSGFVGNYLLKALRDAGHEVVALVRTGSESKLPDNVAVQLVQGDIFAPDSWRHALAGCDGVINLIGIIREFAAQKVTFEKLHVDATTLLVTEMRNAGISRLVQMSANGATPNGVSDYQSTKWRAEEMIKSSGLDYTIFRPSLIFGDAAGKMEMTSELAKVLTETPFIPVFGDGEYLLQPVAVQDVAFCFAAAMTEKKVVGETYHLGGSQKMPYVELFRTIATAVHHGYKPVLNVPFAIIRPIALLLGRFSFFPITTDQLDMLRLGNVCPEERFRSVFGVNPIEFCVENLGYLDKSQERT